MTDIEFEVPATTAHLGPGFGVLGLALDLRFRITVRTTGVDGHVVERLGESTGTALDLRHDAILRGLRAARERWKIAVPDGLAVVVDGDVPRGCGLGSSSADFAAGVGTALRFATQIPPPGELLSLMVELGSDPGHGAAALTGGLAIAIHDVIEPRHPLRFRVLREPIHDAWRLVVVAPDVQTRVADSLRVVPASLPHGIVARTSGRLAGLLQALEKADEELLAYCLVDETHVPYRLQLTPGLAAALRAARDAGAGGATISGHGPAAVALTTDEARCDDIASAMRAAFDDAGVEAASRSCRVCGVGAVP